MDATVELADSVKSQTGPAGQVTISQGVRDVTQALKDYQTVTDQTMDTLEHSLQQWNSYDQGYEKLSNWLKEMEGQVKDFGLVSSLADKQKQLAKFKVRNIHHVSTGLFIHLVLYLPKQSILVLLLVNKS